MELQEPSPATAVGNVDGGRAAAEVGRARLAEVFNQSPSFMAVLRGPDHVFEMANDRYYQLVGRRDIVGKPVRQALPEVDGQGFFELLDGVYATGAPFVGRDLSVLVRRNAGEPPEERFVEFVYQPLRDAGDGRVTGILVHGVDLTERRRAEAALRDSEERLRAVFEQTQTGIAQVGLTGHFELVNQQYCRIVGRTREELLGLRMQDITHPDDLPHNVRLFERAVRTGESFLIEKRYVRPDGSCVWVSNSVSVTRDPGGRPSGVVAAAVDVTARKRVEVALQESEARFRQLADAMPQMVFAAGPDGHVDYFNRQWYEYTGLPEGQVGFESWRHVHTEEGLRRVAEAWPDAVRTGTPYEIEYPLRRRDGQYRWHLGRAVPVRDDAGNVVRWFGTNTDIHDHKMTEDALRCSEERYRSLFNSIDQGFCVVEVMLDVAGRPNDYRFLETNPAFEAQTGLTGAVGRRARELVPGLEARWFEIYGRVAVTGEPARFEDSSDPMGRWFDVYAFRTGEPGERRVAILFKDVTQAKRVEAALRESERRFRDMADTAPAMLWVTEPDGYCSFLSRGWYEFTGQTPAAGLGFGWADAAHPEDRPAARDAFVTANAAREPYAMDFRLRRADGAYRWVIDAGRPRFGPGGEFLGFIGSVIDITDRKRAEDELRDSEARLQLAVQIAEMGTFEIDLLTDAVTVNEPGRRIYGWPAGQPLTFGLVQARFHPDDRDVVMRRVGEAFVPGGPGEFFVEQRIVRTDGAVRWIRVRGRATFEPDAGGNSRAVRCVGTYLDVTEQKEADRHREQLLDAERAARTEAERAGRMKDEFLATLSHELRTPLNAIVGWASILANGKPDPDELRDGLETILRNARAQTQIIEDLLDMSRIVSGKVRLHVEPVDLAAGIRAAVDAVRPAAGAKGIRLQAVLESSSAGVVHGDANRLQQVFWNLLTNAVKFTPRDGHVRVVLARVDSHMELSVIDTGEGIRPEFLPHVFDRFRQADASTTRRHGGLGLGLAIVRQLVELHGGSVRVASPGQGQGATFTVSLPVTAVPPGPDAEGAAGERPRAVPGGGEAVDYDRCPQLAGVRVLVVDDEPDARALVARLLEECRAVVRTSDSAADALEQIAAEAPDVLVSDIGMPGEDGYSLIRKLRALGPDRGGAIPAVALTAYARSEDRVRAIRAGYQTHVVKPVEPAELITVVASLAVRARG